MFRRTVVGISVEDVEKRRLPSKHYVYVVYVTWNDGALNVIYRRYSRFFELQTKLLDKFPEESGSRDPSRRIIPFLPGKILFGRSHIRDVALKRLEPINQYCKTLVKLPSHISECDEVLVFFETSPDDLLQHSKTIDRKPSRHEVKAISHPLLLDQYVAVADYKKQGRNEISLVAGSRVDVVEKTEIGWWFVSTDEGQGWVPSSHLEKEDGSQEDRVVHEADPGEEERFVVVDTYIPMAADEVRIDKGGFVQVVERNLDGWWLVRYQGNEGRVPATNLTKADTLKLSRIEGRVVVPPVEVIPNLMSISNVNRKNIDKLVSESATNANRLGNQASKQETPVESLIDLNFDTIPENGRKGHDENVRHGIDVNFNPLLRSSRRKAPPPRRSSMNIETSDNSDVEVGPPRPALPRMEEVYVAIADLDVTVDDGVSLREGEVVSVLEKTETGWWYVSAGQVRGWAPVSYITKKNQPKKTVSSPKVTKPAIEKNNISHVTLSTSPKLKDVSSNVSNLASVLNSNKPKVEKNRSQASKQHLSASGMSQMSNDAQRKLSSDSTDDHVYKNIESTSPESQVERYVAIYPFEGIEVGEVKLDIGDLLDVLGKNDSGWWYVRVLQGLGEGEGWVPSAYLKHVDNDSEKGATGFDKNIPEPDGYYEEVHNYGLIGDDDASTEWSDTPNSSQVDLGTWSQVQTEAVIEHIPNSNNIPDKSTEEPDLINFESPKHKAKVKDTGPLEDVARLDDYLKANFKGEPPILPTKKSKDTQNGKLQDNLSWTKPKTEIRSSSPSGVTSSVVSPFGVTLKSTGAGQSMFKNKTESDDIKPVLPLKKSQISDNKPIIPQCKPSIPSGKPAVSAQKPKIVSNNQLNVAKKQFDSGPPKPAIPATKPLIKSEKPALPLKKRVDNFQQKEQEKDFKSALNRSNKQNSVNGNKSTFPKNSEERCDASQKSVPPKVQDLAKLFSQT